MARAHTVRQGECISSIAERYGLFPETVWEAPENRDLKTKRGDPNILAPGDVVVIPDKRLKEESGGTEKRHRFRKKGVPARLRFVVSAGDVVPAGTPWVLETESTTLEGETDSDGAIEIVVPVDARRGTLTVGDSGLNRLVFPLAFGALDPITELSGVQGRLMNLGYGCEVTGELDGETQAAIAAFQEEQEIEATGDLDEATRSALGDVYGS